MNFGRRLALYFLLIVLVPGLALVAMLLVVSEDSRRGKADARLASGLDTALALYEGELAEASDVAQQLAADPELAAALTGSGQPDGGALQAFVSRGAAAPGVVAVQVLAPDGAVVASGGSEDAIGFAETSLISGGADSGILRVSTTSADEYAAEVSRLTERELVLERQGETLVATVTPPSASPAAGETVDLELEEGEFRAHVLSLNGDDDETLLLLGPAKEGGFFAVDGLAAALVAALLLLSMIFAYAIARTLTGLHAQVAEQAITDPLTGLWNRRQMMQFLPGELARVRRFGRRMSVLIVDIDDFKSINDELGHPQGDVVLEQIAEIVRSTTRSIDVGARYGGDELALVLLETGAEGALVLAERLRANIHNAEIPLRHGGTMAVTVSIGAATTTDADEDVETLIEAADQALLAAKRAGKDQVQVAGNR
ncbi:MAG: GGDEF domain-containing protein [Actinomycetota bacterium]|nr:GGDEF domain-containing protein [Actinomycetota bacterium]